MKKISFFLLLARIILYHTVLPFGTFDVLNSKNGIDVLHMLEKSVSIYNNKRALKQLFCKTAEQFIALRKHKIQEAQWVPGGTKGHFFVQKLELQTKTGEGPDIKFLTDIHGHTQPLFDLLNSLRKNGWMEKENPFKIRKKNGYIVFLGDYVDRHPHGIQTLLVIMLLYINNPDQVIILRGNHEHIDLNMHYGFFQQLLSCAFTMQDITKIQTLYNLMPSACYLVWSDTKQKKCIVCTHGGPDLRYNPKELLNNTEATHEWLEETQERSGEYLYNKAYRNITTEAAKQELEKNRAMLCAYFRCTYDCDLFSWTDFHEYSHSILKIHQGRGPKLSRSIFTDYLIRTSPENMHIIGIIRGHQHGEFGKQLQAKGGAYILWQDKQFNKNQNNSLELNTLDGAKQPFVITLDGFNPKVGHQNAALTLSLDKALENGLLSLEAIKKQSNIPS